MNLADQLRGLGVASFPCWVRKNSTTGGWDKGPAVPKGVSWLTVALNPGDYPALDWASPVFGLPIPQKIAVLDLDTYKGSSREEVDMALGGPLPWDAAMIQRTIGGGGHYAFRCSWDLKQGANIGVRGLDTRSPGRGFICSGEGYTPVGFGVFAFANPEALPVLPDFCRPVLERVTAPPRELPAPAENRDDEQVVAALSHLDPGCSRPEWLDVGFALKALYTDSDYDGRAMFDRWSAGEFWKDGTPANYEPDGKGSPGEQWGTFKADGAVRPATLFYRAMQAGWAPPASFDTAAAFGSGAAPESVYSDLVDRVRSFGGDVARVPDLIGEIQAAGCNALQVALLAAEVKSALKDVGIKDAKVGRLVDSLLATREPRPDHPGTVPDAGRYLDDNTPLHPDAWAPMQTKGKDRKPKGTLRNFEIMLQAYAVGIKFDEIRKTLEMTGPTMPGAGVLHEEAALSYLDSLANLNDYPVADVRRMIMPVANKHTLNPVADYVSSAPWDGRDHIGELWGQMVLDPDEDAEFCEVLFRKWMRGAYGIGTGALDRWEFVIVLIDPNGGAGKTRFFSTFCPKDLQTDSVILDTGNKDSVKMAISYWLTELGELDGTFTRSESSRIKAFLSLRQDEMRLPYGRAYLKYPRRTAFWASVNETHFLIDPSDNRRFWGIRVQYANHQHRVNLQQVWAQAAAELNAGAAAHLTPQENQILAARNDAFRTGSPVVDALGSLTLTAGNGEEHRTVSDVLAQAGVSRPNKADLNEAARWLRRMGFRETKRNGRRGFNVIVDAYTAPAFQPTLIGDKK